MEFLSIPFLAASLLLTACGGSEPAAPSQTAKNPTAAPSGKLNAWGRDLVKEEDCHPAVALALQPYEADYGQCQMKT